MGKEEERWEIGGVEKKGRRNKTSGIPGVSTLQHVNEASGPVQMSGRMLQCQIRTKMRPGLQVSL